MKWNRDEIIRLLKARVADEPSANGGRITVLHFEDTRMRYELWINVGIYSGPSALPPFFFFNYRRDDRDISLSGAWND